MCRFVDKMNHAINDRIKDFSDNESLKLSDDEIQDLKMRCRDAYMQGFCEQLALRLLNEMRTW
jgi:hypothetical protein